jgi:hypothetical protein
LNFPSRTQHLSGREACIRSFRLVFYNDTIGGKAEVERNLRRHLEAIAVHVYLPTHTSLAPGRLFGGSLVFRIRANRDKALAAVQSAVESVDPSLLPGLDLVSLEDGPVALQRGFFRVLAAFAGTLTLLSLTLAGVGIYGVMAFLVSQRTREIGIRMALGATSRSVIKSVVVQGLRPVFVGTLVGLAGSAWVTKLAWASEGAHVLGLYSHPFSDPALYGELALVLAIAVLAASFRQGERCGWTRQWRCGMSEARRNQGVHYHKLNPPYGNLDCHCREREVHSPPPSIEPAENVADGRATGLRNTAQPGG